jgi:aspartate aminotransferase-like enzyme
LEARFNRHLRCSLALQEGIEGLGLSLFVAPPARLNSVVGVNVPGGINKADLLSYISDQYRVEISGSFGPNIVRIGQMGEQSRDHNVFRTLHALGSSIKALGGAVDVPAGVAALENALGSYIYRDIKI